MLKVPAIKAMYVQYYYTYVCAVILYFVQKKCIDQPVVNLLVVAAEQGK